MRLRTYVLTVAFCATTGVAFAQGPGNEAVASRQTAVASATSTDAGQTAAATAQTATAGAQAAVAPAVQTSATVEVSDIAAPNPNLQAVLQEHPVITTDDLREMRFNFAEVFIPTEFTNQPVVNPALCDAGCEVEARAAAGMDHVPDRAWEAQFAAARMDLAGDQEWRKDYADGMQRLHSYCVFQRQAKKAFPHAANGGASPNQREQWQQYVDEMNQSLGAGVDSSAARIQQAIQQAQEIDSVRAAIMEVLAERAFSHCSAGAR